MLSICTPVISSSLFKEQGNTKRSLDFWRVNCSKHLNKRYHVVKKTQHIYISDVSAETPDYWGTIHPVVIVSALTWCTIQPVVSNSDHSPGYSEQDVTGKHQKELGLLAC
jgi:hypothetical protein